MIMWLTASTTTATVSILNDLATGIAALLAVRIAWNGLTTWKRELQGKTEYELARKYLGAAYKLRDAVKYVRNPFVPIEETYQAVKESGLPDSDRDNHQKSTRAVYSMRWKRVAEAVSSLRVELLEAEIAWGKDAVDVQKDFQDCIKTLYISLNTFLDNRLRDPEKLEEIDKIIYESRDKDSFNQDLDRAIGKIEDYLKPHLGRK